MIRPIAGVVVAMGLVCSQVSAPATQAPRSGEATTFRYEPSWPPPLPHKWILGQVSQVAVDSRDHVWILTRPASLPADVKGASLDPPTAECCIPAPPVIEFDVQGNVVRGWGGPGAGYEWPTQEHGITVDDAGNVWISGTGQKDSHILKFSGDGKPLTQIGRPGQPWLNSDTSTLGKPADMQVDPRTNEIYVADGEGGNRRVIVFDAITGAYRRHWGAYGEKPEDTAPLKYDPAGPASRVFSSAVHCVRVAKDGLVYVCDRGGDRIQVFRTDGTFVKEGFVAKQTLGIGSTSDIEFSPDQTLLYVADGANGKVWILKRDSLEIVSSFGQMGANAGQFRGLHGIAVDSKGNIYTGEVTEGKRVQKFVPSVR